MIYLAWGAALLLIFLLLSRWLAETHPKNVKRLLYVLGALLLAALGLFLVFTGKALAALPALAAAWAFYDRYRRAKWFWNTAKRWAGRAQQGSSAGASAGQGTASNVKTVWLEMRLDHASGDLNGRVRQGAFKGRRLSDLGELELVKLRAEIQASDSEGLRLLDAYLERRFGAGWRARFSAGDENGGGRSARGGSEAMTRKEALEVLGLEEGAKAEEIRRAHRKLLQKIHPDHGGSGYLAAKINEAKGVLLKK